MIKKRILTILIASLILIFSLVFIRFIEFKYLWAIQDILVENIKECGGKDVLAVDFGFSKYSNAQNQFNSILKKSDKKIIIVRFFNFYYPSVFFVFNKNNYVIKNIPFINYNNIDPGFTKIFFSKMNYIKIKTSSGIKKINFQILESFIFSTIDLLKSNKHNKLIELYNIKTLQKFAKLRFKLFLIYFIVPFILITCFSYLISKKIFISFLYFFEMLFLFSLYFILIIPGFIIKELFKISYSIKPFIIVIIICIFVFLIFYYFIKMLFLAFKLKKESTFKFIEVLIILFFLLLPFNLRF